MTTLNRKPAATAANRKGREGRDTSLRPRITKGLIEEVCEQRAARIRRECGFDPNNGTAQLRSGPMSDELIGLIDRSVAYGRMIALERLAEDLRDGTLALTTDA